MFVHSLNKSFKNKLKSYVWKKLSVFSTIWSIIHLRRYLNIDYEKKTMIFHHYFYGIIIRIKKIARMRFWLARKKNTNILNQVLWGISNDKNNAAFLKVIKYAIQHLFIHQLKKITCISINSDLAREIDIKYKETKYSSLKWLRKILSHASTFSLTPLKMYVII